MKIGCYVISLTLFFILNQTGFAAHLGEECLYLSNKLSKSNSCHRSIITKENLILKKSYNRLNYLPYLEVAGIRFSTGESRTAVGTDLFIPLWQSYTDLVFGDLRFYDRTGRPFEGNIQLGYRHLSPEKEYLLGVYGAFDRKRSEFGNYFNQITVGGEYWLKSLFLGINFYQPIGDATKPLDVAQATELDRVYRNIWITTNRQAEKAMQGCDVQIGYEFVRGLAWYVGGYYFNAKDTETIYGPKVRIVYDWSLENGKRILGVFDKLGLEVGVQRDKPRGTILYANAKVRIGLLLARESNLEGVARHMVDLIHRDVDIVLQTVTDGDCSSGEFCGGNGFDEHGIHKITKTKYDEEGFDVNGKNKRGWDRAQAEKRRKAAGRADEQRKAEQEREEKY